MRLQKAVNRQNKMTTPEIQAINHLVAWFDELTEFKNDTWSLPQIVAWFDGFRAGAQQGKDTNDN